MQGLRFKLEQSAGSKQTRGISQVRFAPYYS